MNNNQTGYTKNYLIQFEQALKLIQQSAQSLASETIEISQASGRVLALAINSPEAVPPFANSAMDGYAVNAGDIANASTQAPVKLELVGVAAAGDSPASIDKSQGKAFKIMTGAPMPSGFDSIIPVEETQLDNQTVSCFAPVSPGAHLRHKGEDFQLDEPIARVGERLTSNHLTAFAALGIDAVEVYQRPTVAVFSTGKELVDDLKQSLKPGQIRNSNKLFILDWLKSLPVEALDMGTNQDDAEKFEQDLQRQLERDCKIIISTGAVSMGDFDFIPKTIVKLGGEIIFHKIKIKPGKPILFARFKNGSYYFGLPGNPISAAIGLRFFVSTLVRQLCALPLEKPLPVVTANSYHKKPGFRLILKAKTHIDEQARFQAEILDGQESFKIKPLLSANGWLTLDESAESIEPGNRAYFYPNQVNWD